MFVEDREGVIVVPFPEHEIVWTEQLLRDIERSLAGVRARVIPLELLREGKQHPREAAADAAKDVADQAALASL